MSTYHNCTRRSESIPRRLAEEGRIHLIPLYYLLTLSDLAREGIRNSGSYRFADHIYAGRPSGRFLIGRLLDAVLLRMKAAESFRARYIYAMDELRRFAAMQWKYTRSAAVHAELMEVHAAGVGIEESGRDAGRVETAEWDVGSAGVAESGVRAGAVGMAESDVRVGAVGMAESVSGAGPLRIAQTADIEAPPMRILAVPCGLARELFELADEWSTRGVDAELHGLDLDSDLIDNVRSKARQAEMDIRFHVGDALSEEAYPGRFDAVLSTGFTEFLDDDEVLRFYRLVFEHLNPGGWFITSGLSRHGMSDFLLRHLAEIDTRYRSTRHLRALARCAGFKDVTTYRDRHGFQTMMICGRPAEPGRTYPSIGQ